jgi:ribosomal protein L37E
MSMVYCRGCGKQIHETADRCPHCGYRQAIGSLSGFSWSAALTITASVICVINWLIYPSWTIDHVVGNALFGLLGLVSAVFWYRRTIQYRVASILCVGVSLITLILSLGFTPS